MRKTALIFGVLIFVGIECFLVRLILKSGPDSKEFYATPISELGKPINEFFHQQDHPKASQDQRRRPASKQADNAPLRALDQRGHPQVYPRTITFEKVEPYLGEPLPIQDDLLPVYGAIVEDPRMVKEALGEFLGFFHGKVIYVNPQASKEFIRHDERMMLVVGQQRHTFFLVTGTISVIFKDIQEAGDVAREYHLELSNILTNMNTASFKIPLGRDIRQLLAKLKEDPRFIGVYLDLITDSPVQVL